MEELIKAAFAEGVTPRDFFMTHFKAIHEARLDKFSDLSTCPLIISFLFEDTGNRFTFELSSKGYKVEEGDMIDFPILTIVGNEKDWPTSREPIREAALTLFASEDTLQKKYGRKPITQDFKDDFEAMIGTIEVEVTGGSSPISFKLYLNDYDEDGGPNTFKLSLDRELVLGVARGDLDPRGLQKKVKIGGKMAFAMELGGFLQKRFDG